MEAETDALRTIWINEFSRVIQIIGADSKLSQQLMGDVPDNVPSQVKHGNWLTTHMMQNKLEQAGVVFLPNEQLEFFSYNKKGTPILFRDYTKDFVALTTLRFLHYIDGKEFAALRREQVSGCGFQKGEFFFSTSSLMLSVSSGPVLTILLRNPEVASFFQHQLSARSRWNLAREAKEDAMRKEEHKKRREERERLEREREEEEEKKRLIKRQKRKVKREQELRQAKTREDEEKVRQALQEAERIEREREAIQRHEIQRAEAELASKRERARKQEEDQRNEAATEARKRSLKPAERAAMAQNVREKSPSPAESTGKRSLKPNERATMAQHLRDAESASTSEKVPTSSAQQLQERQAKAVQSIQDEQIAKEHRQQRRNDVKVVIDQYVETWVATTRRNKSDIVGVLRALHTIVPINPPLLPVASEEENLAEAVIRKAYHKALIQIHPDKHVQDELELQLLFEATFSVVSNTWQNYLKRKLKDSST
jgi:hypothetical protein